LEDTIKKFKSGGWEIHLT